MIKSFAKLGLGRGQIIILFAALGLLLLSLTPLILYPFAFHDDLVVPYYFDCGATISHFADMGRPGLGLIFCLNANLLPGFENTQVVRSVSVFLVVVNFLLVVWFALREQVQAEEGILLSLLVFVTAPSVLLVFYVASAPELYGNLLATVAALLAQRLSFRLIVQGDSAVAPASVGLLLASVAAGTTAYAFYQPSGVFYFALTAIVVLATGDVALEHRRRPIRNPLSDFRGFFFLSRRFSMVRSFKRRGAVAAKAALCGALDRRLCRYVLLTVCAGHYERRTTHDL